MSDEAAGPGFIENAGLTGLLAVAIGLVILALGVRVAMQRGPRRQAIALLAAAWLPLPLVLLARLDVVRALGPAVTPKDLAAGVQSLLVTSACGALALILGLSGAVAALARSSPTTRSLTPTSCS